MYGTSLVVRKSSGHGTVNATIHAHVFLLRVFEHVDACKDLKCRSQLNVHGAHEVVFLQEEQGLTVDLLRAELICDLLTTCTTAEEDIRSLHKLHVKLYERTDSTDLVANR